jgi:hypothetical protein
MMDASLPSIIAVFFALLLAALILALILSRGFRNAVLGGPGEATILNLITVKGVAIVLLCGLLIGGLMFALEKSPRAPEGGTHADPIAVRLNVHFEPDEVNPRNPQFRAQAFMKTSERDEPIPIVTKVVEGALSVQVNVPDMETPFYIVFQTPGGIWQTDDHSIREASATARKQ